MFADFSIDRFHERNPRPDCQRSSSLYTAKLNFNNRRLQKIGLSCQRRTPIPQMEPVRFSRDSQIIRFGLQVNEEFANVLENFLGNGLLHVDLRAPVELPRPCSDFLIRSTLGLLNRPQMKSVAFLLLCITSVAFAEDFKTTRGKEYKNVSVSRIEPDGIVLKTKSGISKIYFVELPKDVQERFHYNPANAAAYSAAQALAKPGLGGRGQPVEIISHGTQVDINQHLARGYVTIVDFYADWCPACRWLSPRLEQMAASDPQIALRKIDIVNWKTAVARQFTIDSLPWVSIYNRVGQLIGTVSGADIDQIKSYVAQAKARG